MCYKKDVVEDNYLGIYFGQETHPEGGGEAGLGLCRCKKGKTITKPLHFVRQCTVGKYGKGYKVWFEEDT